jgi:PhnB protein
MAKPIPDGYHTVTPSLVVKGGAQAIEFYKKAFGATEHFRMPGPDGKSLMHAELKIGDSIVMLADEQPDTGCKAPTSVGVSTSSLFLYVKDVDAGFKKAVEAGATPEMPPADMFWGDRFGQVRDPFGHLWGLGTHKEDLAPEEIAKRQQQFFASMSAKK